MMGLDLDHFLAYAEQLSVPKELLAFVVLVEDKRFFSHHGLDFIGIARAMLANLRHRKIAQGASTNSQQVFNIRLSQLVNLRHRRSLSRKLRQILFAIKLEAGTSKLEILREYLNSVYWGESYYGVDEASFGYFQKSKDVLTPIESFLLAERLAAPNRFNLRRFANVLKRKDTKTVLEMMGITTNCFAVAALDKFREMSSAHGRRLR